MHTLRCTCSETVKSIYQS